MTKTAAALLIGIGALCACEQPNQTPSKVTPTTRATQKQRPIKKQPTAHKYDTIRLNVCDATWSSKETQHKHTLHALVDGLDGPIAGSLDLSEEHSTSPIALKTRDGSILIESVAVIARFRFKQPQITRHKQTMQFAWATPTFVESSIMVNGSRWDTFVKKYKVQMGHKDTKAFIVTFQPKADAFAAQHLKMLTTTQPWNASVIKEERALIVMKHESGVTLTCKPDPS